MATNITVKLSQLPALSGTLKSASVLPVTQDGTTYKATVAQVEAAVAGLA